MAKCLESALLWSTIGYNFCVMWSLFLCFFYGPAKGDRAQCSEFLSIIPASPELVLLRFHVGESPCGSRFSVKAAEEPEGLSLNPDSPTVVIVTGRRPSTVQPTWVRTMAKELLAVGLHNVLAADWLLPSQQEITEGARLIGERLAKLINTLGEAGMPLEKFHLIGFGVGAHISGVTGRYLHSVIGRITGLDPFSPMFIEANKSVSLDYTDAQYVDVIHTNFNPNEPVAALGFIMPVGHVDFYIGKGHLLPGCPQSLMNRQQYLLCSHQRAIKLFTSSIQAPCPLTAFPCQAVVDFLGALCTRCHHPGLNVCPQLGYNISWLPVERPIPFQPLTAVLDVTKSAPYCVYPFLLKVSLEGNASLKAQLLIQLKGYVNKTSVMLVSSPAMINFQPNQTYYYIVSADHVEDFKTISIEFNSRRLLYFQWMKRTLLISHLKLIQLPTDNRVSYWTQNFSAVENQRIEMHLQKTLK